MAKNLDAELAEAAGLGNAREGKDDGAMSVPRPAARARPAGAEAPRRSVGLLATLLAMVAAVVCLFLFGLKEAAIYSTPVDKLLAEADKHVGRPVRVDGELVPGSLAKRDRPCEYRFTMRAGGRELPVRYPMCVVPDTFRDVPEGGVLVTAEGALAAEGHLVARNIMAKCTSKYDPSTHTMKPAEAAAPPGADGQPIN
jgi:cytochrome c-type biogenesis protein CcmE